MIRTARRSALAGWTLAGWTLAGWVIALTSPVCAQHLAPLVGSVIDPDGEPVVGAEVVVTRFAGAGMELIDLEYRYTKVPVASMKTGRQGRFAFQLPIGVPVQLVVDAEPWGRWRRDSVMPGDELAILLAHPATLRGVVQLADGTGLQATLRAWDAARCKHIVDARTRADGTFELTRLPPTALTLSVVPDDAMMPSWSKVVLQAGETTELTVTTARGRSLKGRITDADGDPVAGALVGEGWTMRKRTTAAADGRYELRGFGADGYDSVHVRAPEFVNQTIAKTALGDAEVHDFVLQPGRTVTGRVFDDAGGPIENVYVAVVPNDDLHNWSSDRTQSDGAFEVRGIRPEKPIMMLVRAPGFATEVFHLPWQEPGEITVPDLRLRRPQVIAGVLLEDGKPVANRLVQLDGAGAEVDRYQVGGLNRLRTYLAQREVHTNQHGQFAFGDLPPGEFKVRIGQSDAVPVRATPTPRPVEIDLGR